MSNITEEREDDNTNSTRDSSVESNTSGPNQRSSSNGSGKDSSTQKSQNNRNQNPNPMSQNPSGTKDGDRANSNKKSR